MAKALVLGTRDREFDSHHPDHITNAQIRMNQLTHDILESVNDLGHKWQVCNIDTGNYSAKTVEVAYSCTECSLFCFVDVSFTQCEEGLIFSSAAVEEANFSCAEYIKLLNKTIDSHNFTDNQCCSRCGIERYKTDSFPSWHLTKPSWSETSLVSCSEILLYNMLL